MNHQIEQLENSMVKITLEISTRYLRVDGNGI